MDEFWGMSSTVWTGVYTIFTFGLLVVAVVAALYASKQWRLAREQAEDARRARVEASRPYVLVTVEASGASPQLFDLVVKNIGRRPALSVSIAIDPPLMRAHETTGHEISQAKMLNEPVAMIAPGQEMRAFYDSHIDRRGRDDLPTSHQVLLTYRDSSGRDYSETSVLDIEGMKGTLHASVQTIHDISKTLKVMEQTLSGASILRRHGELLVEASIESRAEYHRRLTEEQAQQEEQARRLMQEFGFATSPEVSGEEPGNRGESSHLHSKNLFKGFMRRCRNAIRSRRL